MNQKRTFGDWNPKCIRGQESVERTFVDRVPVHTTRGLSKKLVKGNNVRGKVNNRIGMIAMLDALGDPCFLKIRDLIIH